MVSALCKVLVLTTISPTSTIFLVMRLGPGALTSLNLVESLGTTVRMKMLLRETTRVSTAVSTTPLLQVRTQTSILAPQVPGQDTNATRRTNFQSFANFLQGNNVTFSQAHFDYTADLRQKVIEGYAQDEWRFRPNLTLYYGLRYSFFGSPYDKNNRLSNFDPALYNPASGPQVTGAGNRVVGTGNFCNGMTVNSQMFQTAPNGCTPAVSPLGNYVVDAQKD